MTPDCSAISPSEDMDRTPGILEREEEGEGGGEREMREHVMLEGMLIYDY
jgi:hypothetical protein